MKNKILKLALALLIFTAIPLNAYAKGIAEIRIHKNELTGEIYSNENRPIKVIIEKQGEPLKIGIEIPNVNDPEKYTPERGGLYKKDTKICTYEWYEGDKKRKEIIKLDRYEQAPAGEFFAPPERISQDRLIFFEDNILNCGGGKVNYLQMQEWLSTRPLNPFKNYSEKLKIEADEGQYQINIARDEDRIKTTGNLKLSGYFCEKDNKKGLCSEHFSIKDQEKTQIDLIIIADGEERQIPSTEDLISGINAEYSSAVTFVGSFSSRASSLLDWTLSIEETGLRNPKIEQIFNKFLNIANGLFILVLLGIAFLWNFSIFLPKNSLHKMLAFFAIAMLSVNFALPLTRLAVDGANILQESLLVKKGTEATKRINSQDILELSNIESGTFVGLEKTSYIEKSYPTQIGEEVDTANLKQKDDLYINRYKEQTYFNLILISLGAFAELIIALILIFRYVIIWFLLIFSPFLFVLFIFPSLRSVFRYWIWLFSRWIMIGPILAMALFVVINIWVHTGIPLESSYQAPSSLVFINTTNLQIASPSGSGGLETPRNIMKYISSLMMLYLCILLPFWLTRIIPASISKDSFSSLQKSLESKSEQEHDIIRKIQEKIEESSISKSKTNSIITQALGLNKNSTVANFLNQEKQEEATKERLQQTQGLKTSSNKHLQNTQTKTQENELSSMLTKKEDQLEQKNDENQSIIKISTPSIKIQEDSTKQEQKEAQNKEIIKNTSKIDQASEKISEQQKTEIQKEIKSSNSIKSITEDKKITRESRKDQIKSQKSITEKIKVERPEIRENKKIEDIIKEKESLKNKNKKTT